MFSNLSVYNIGDIDEIIDRISGNNQKNCLVIVSSAIYDGEMQAFLKKIFSAVSMDLEMDCTLYKWMPSDNTSLLQLKKDHTFKTCILFGVPSDALGLKINNDLWKIIGFQHFSLLICESLLKIAVDQGMKKLLWENLKQLFK